MTQHDDTLILIVGYGQMTYKQAKERLDMLTKRLQHQSTSVNLWLDGTATARAIKKFEDKIKSENEYEEIYQTGPCPW